VLGRLLVVDKRDKAPALQGTDSTLKVSIPQIFGCFMAKS